MRAATSRFSALPITSNQACSSCGRLSARAMGQLRLFFHPMAALSLRSDLLREGWRRKVLVLSRQTSSFISSNTKLLNRIPDLPGVDQRYTSVTAGNRLKVAFG